MISSILGLGTLYLTVRGLQSTYKVWRTDGILGIASTGAAKWKFLFDILYLHDKSFLTSYNNLT